MVVVILRGAMDGLAAVPPIGDPDYPALRRDLAIGTAGLEATLPLNSFFGLNKAMGKFYAEYNKRGKSHPSKAEALRRAQIELKNDLRFRHPCYWAPYLVIGNWR
jgi:uncharacterized protein (DUF1501 family)